MNRSLPKSISKNLSTAPNPSLILLRRADEPASSQDLQLACGAFVLLLIAALADLFFRL